MSPLLYCGILKTQKNYSDMARFIILPKPDNVVIGLDLGEGDDISVKIIERKMADGSMKMHSCEYIGLAKDFDTEEKINQYIEKL